MLHNGFECRTLRTSFWFFCRVRFCVLVSGGNPHGLFQRRPPVFLYTISSGLVKNIAGLLLCSRPLPQAPKARQKNMQPNTAQSMKWVQMCVKDQTLDQQTKQCALEETGRCRQGATGGGPCRSHAGRRSRRPARRSKVLSRESRVCRMSL